MSHRSMLLWLLPILARVEAEAQPLSPRNASYRIAVELDPVSKTLTAKETLTWKNLQSIEALDLRFHLYWNAWRNNRSTWLQEARLRTTGRNLEEPREGDWSSAEVESIRLVPDVGVPSIDVTSQARYASTDDDNPEDRTVLVVPLDAPVPPEGVVQVEIDWKSRVPRTFARTGYRGKFFFIAQWFPKLAVFEAT